MADSDENASQPTTETATATETENVSEAENGAQKVSDTAEAAPKVPVKADVELPGKLGMLNNVSVTLTIEVGRTSLKIRDLLSLTKGSIIELDKMAGEPVDIYVNGRMIAQGNIITANGKYCVRLLTVKQNNPESF